MSDFDCIPSSQSENKSFHNKRKHTKWKHGNSSRDSFRQTFSDGEESNLNETICFTSDNIFIEMGDFSKMNSSEVIPQQNQSSEKNTAINLRDALYEGQTSDGEENFPKNVVLFEQELPLEKADRYDQKYRPKFPTPRPQTDHHEDFVSAWELSQMENLTPEKNETNASTAPTKRRRNTDILLEELNMKNIQLSQWDSPIKKFTTIQEVSVEVSEENQIKVNLDSPPKSPPRKVCRYDLIGNKKDCISAHNSPISTIIDSGDDLDRHIIEVASESLSSSSPRNSISSELSIQNDVFNETAHCFNQISIDLNNSIFISQNLHNLSEFFMQNSSIVEESDDTLANEIYDHIIKIRRMNILKILNSLKKEQKEFRKLPIEDKNEDFLGFDEENELESCDNTLKDQTLQEDNNKFLEIIQEESNITSALENFGNKFRKRTRKSQLDLADPSNFDLGNISSPISLTSLDNDTSPSDVNNLSKKFKTNETENEIDFFESPSQSVFSIKGNELLNKEFPNIPEKDIQCSNKSMGPKNTKKSISFEMKTQFRNVFSENRNFITENCLEKLKREETKKESFDSHSMSNACKDVKTFGNSINLIQHPSEDTMRNEEMCQEKPSFPMIAKGTAPFLGFKFVSGKNVKVSEKALLKAKNLSEEFEKEERKLNLTISSNLKNSEAASSNSVVIDTKSKPKHSEDHENEMLPNSKTSSALCLGFKFASGKNSTISKNSMLKANKLFADFEKEGQLDIEVSHTKVKDTDEKLTTSTSVHEMEKVSHNSLNVAANEFQEFKENKGEVPQNEMFSNAKIKENPQNITLTKMPSIGFKLASGKTSAISSNNAILRATKLFADFEKENILEFEDLFNKNENRKTPTLNVPRRNQLDSLQTNFNRNVEISKSSKINSFIGFSPVLGKARKELEKRPTKLFSLYTDDEIKENSLDSSNIKCSININQSKEKLKSSINISHNQEKKHFSLNSGNLRTPKNIRTKSGYIFNHSSPNTLVKTPSSSKHMEIDFNDTPNLKEFFKLNVEAASTPQGKTRPKYSISTQEISAITSACAEDDFKTGASLIDDLQAISWDDFEDSFDEEVSRQHDKNVIKITKSNLVRESVINVRNKSREVQQSIIRNKENNSVKIDERSQLYKQKKTTSRVSLLEYVKGSNPKLHTTEELIKLNVKPYFAGLHKINVDKFKFSISSDTMLCPEKEAIVLDCGTLIIPDNSNKIGLKELTDSFLSMNGVMKNLMPENWIKHHYKMLIEKYIWLEKSFPRYFANLLCTPENILLQLKYRYDVEIDKTKRSCLRKILEGDDSSVKRMVCVVSDIIKENDSFELDLSDRWYSVRAEIDPAMRNLISLGKIIVGTKLMIQNAELLNCCQGCDPLNVPNNVRLRIHTNSTRRANWYLKLGFYKVSIPFPITLDSVKVNGGLISKLNLVILRVYPSVYLSKSSSEERSNIHSEKVERRLRQNDEKLSFDHIENVYSQVRKEFEGKGLNRDYDGSGLESENDPQMYIKWQEEIGKKVRDRMENIIKRKSSEILKLRVIDSKGDSSKSAILSIWNPEESLKESLKEGTQLIVTNCNVKNIQFDSTLQLNTTKTTEYQFFKNSKNAMSTELLPKLRRFSTIKEINSDSFNATFLELDTFGFIFYIEGNESFKKQNFQSIYICDHEENILCIKFWSSIKDYAYDDLIKRNEFILANNLQWRTIFSKQGLIKTAFVTDITRFSSNIKVNSEIEEYFNSVKDYFAESNFAIVERKFMKIIEEHEKSSLLKKSNNNNSSLSNTTANSSIENDTSLKNISGNVLNCSKSPITPSNKKIIPSVETRIKRLGMYKSPAITSPLVCAKRKLSCRAKFKPPRRLDESN